MNSNMAQISATNQHQMPDCGSWCGGTSEFGTKNTNAAAAAAARNATSVHESDVLLAREMNELSVQERERVFDDVHGVAKIPTETPAFVTKRLEELDVALSKIPVKRRKALDRAVFLKPTIHNDVKFKLMFLRAELYDATKAAKRMSRHFEEKLTLFGEERLVKKITLEDLGEDIQYLNVLGCVLLPNKDPTGRPIWFFDMTNFDPKNHEASLRCFWYLVMVSAEDEIAQLKGACSVAYCPGDIFALPASISTMSKMMVRAGQVFEGFPIRKTAFQFCYSDMRAKLFISQLGNVLGKSVRLRLRSHFGSDLEIQYSLMTFGISCHYLFHSAGSDEQRTRVREALIRRRRGIERIEEEARMEEEQRSGIILHPQPKDVLVGRGRPYQEFPGNQRLGGFVEKRLERVRKAKDRFEKTIIFMEVVKNIQATNGRFLHKTSEGWWKITTDKIAREKTCSAFRSKMAGYNADENNNNNNNNNNANGKAPATTATTETSDSTTCSSSSSDDRGAGGDIDQDRSSKRARYDPSVVKLGVAPVGEE